MSNTPIRAKVYTVCEPIEDPTLRQLVEWSKRVVEVLDGEDPSPQEMNYIQQQWGTMVEDKAAKEQIPAGTLSYMLQEIQMAEQAIVDQALQDVQSG